MGHESGFVAMRARVAWFDLPLIGKLGAAAEKFSSTCHGVQSFDLFFFSKNRSTFGVWCRVHGHVEKGKISMLQMILNRKPSSKQKPSPKMVQCSKELGGYPNGLDALLSELGTSPLLCNCSADLLALRVKLKMKRRPKRGDFSPFNISGETIKLEKKDGTSIEVEFGSFGESIQVESDLNLIPNAECFEHTCELLLKKAKPLIEPK